MNPGQWKTPTLTDVFPLALNARATGEAWFDVDISGLGREWAPRVPIRGATLPKIGVWGKVVARKREAPRGVDPRNVEAGVDTGPITRLLIRLSTMEVLEAVRREEVERYTPVPVKSFAQRRIRPRNVTIR